MRRHTTALGIGGYLLLEALPTQASTSGSIALRGIVNARAEVRTLAASAPITLRTSATRESSTSIPLSAFVNGPGAVTFSLGTNSSFDGNGLTLQAEDGSFVTYRVRFGGQSLDLSHGEVAVARITRDTMSADQALEIVAPTAASKDKHYSAHLVLTVTAQ
jgi:hypothetical protein